MKLKSKTGDDILKEIREGNTTQDRIFYKCIKYNFIPGIKEIIDSSDREIISDDISYKFFYEDNSLIFNGADLGMIVYLAMTNNDSELLEKSKKINEKNVKDIQKDLEFFISVKGASATYIEKLSTDSIDSIDTETLSTYDVTTGFHM